MIKNFEQIQRDLAAKQYHSVYFLTGEESFFTDTISDYIAENVLDESEKSFNLSIFYGKESSPGNIIESALRFPMMSDYNVIILKEAQDFKKFDEFTKYFQNPNDKSIVVFCCKRMKLDKRTAVYKALKESSSCCFMEASRVYENKIAPWIDNYLAPKKLKITNKASALLIEYLGSDLSKIANELEKLIKIKNETGVIDLDDIEYHIGISKDYNIFELQNALGSKNSNKVAKICRYYQANIKSNPIYMTTGALFNFFSRSFVLENNGKSQKETANELGISDWQMKSYYPVLKNYKGTIGKVLAIIQEYDLKSKGINDRGTDQGELTKEMLFKILMA
ncbi:MAG: DNA polymerase III subunit delta [Bacteroidetes bacterium]|jgi:DNA polymerase-3 subunit delta|nr:DNA polymerase III subunit delta [Bacteroidota bacterium]MBT5529327.1 DNA polymerase III subunit delta [Cytophagia bacterium]MBT3422761.1 DNA polymerase III subunit delta [Bacteroidota bacterium]MBT3800009.1 DNA polymerase III subunit delta [Bacteroidota bacterium]MBT3934058.1 DNA polymerase III subunit delta [Bacteroidota bacterium]